MSGRWSAKSFKSEIFLCDSLAQSCTVGQFGATLIEITASKKHFADLIIDLPLFLLIN